MSGFWRAVLIGAVTGVLVVGVIVGAVVLGFVPGTQDRGAQASDGPVLVALVLPDADGIKVVRTLSVLERAGNTLRMSSIDPLTAATVPGTSGTTLAEAYSFGGGAGVAKAYAQLKGSEDPLWAAVTPKGWTALVGSTRIPVTMPANIEVFDGSQLYSYAKGDPGFPASEVAKVMDGAAHLSASDRETIRDAAASALITALARKGAQEGPGIETNMRPEEYAIWLAALKKGVAADEGTK